MENSSASSPAITLDAHLDVPWQMTKLGYTSLHRELEDRDVDFPRMRAGGLQAGVFALYLPDSMLDSMNLVDWMPKLQMQWTAIAGQGGITTSVESAVQFSRNGGIPIFLGLEGARILNGSLDALRLVAKWGVRYLTLTHNRNIPWADSATDVPRVQGIEPIGEKIIQECNKLGIIVDVSHVAIDSAYAALDLSSRPVIASHSGVRELQDHPRNISLWLARRIAATGGVIGVPFVKKFLGPYSVADHIDILVQKVGVNHVGIGSDLDGAECVIDSVVDWSFWKEPLAKKGYSDNDLAAVAGRNFLRVLGTA